MGYNEYNYQVYLETKKNYTLEDIKTALKSFAVGEENASTLVLDFNGWKLWIHLASDADVETEAAEMADFYNNQAVKACNARLEIYAEDDPDEAHYNDHLHVIETIAELDGTHTLDQYVGEFILEKNSPVFEDLNFKISVIGALHELDFYKEEAEALCNEFGDEDNYSYEPIPEVMEYYTNLEIDPEKLAKIEGLYPDGGDECYMFAMDNWDGEDETFDISSIEGIQLLVNLKTFDPISMIAYESLDYAPLLACKNLVKVNAGYMKPTAENEAVIQALAERGVEITGRSATTAEVVKMDTSFLEFIPGNSKVSYYIDTIRENTEQDWEIWHNLGYEYGTQKPPMKELERKCYDVSLELHPQNYQAYFNLGKGFYSSRDYQSAREYYMKCIEIEPEFASVWESLAQVAGKEGKQDEALEHLEKAIEVDPDDLNSNINMAYYLIKYGKAASALEFAEKAFSHGDIYTSSFNKGHIYFVQNEIELAVESYAISLRAAEHEGADFWDDYEADAELLVQYGITSVKANALKKQIEEKVKTLPPRELNEIADLLLKCAYRKQPFLNEEKVMILESLEIPEIYIDWLNIANRSYDTDRLPHAPKDKSLQLKNYDALLEEIYDEYNNHLLSCGYIPFGNSDTSLGYVFDIKNNDTILEVNYQLYTDEEEAGNLDDENENLREYLAEKVMTETKFDSFESLLQWYVEALKL